MELSLLDDLDSVDMATQLANELPDRETHEKITLAFMDHIGNYDHCYTSILLSLRTLLMFTDYDYTFNCLTRFASILSTNIHMSQAPLCADRPHALCVCYLSFC